jgi:ferric-dicitrate binding protein FerR (iron transport regulator)
MGISSDLLSAPKEFLHLFKAGKDAAKDGDNARAHDLFRQAIEIDPYHEQVWLWLASVVETDEDRRVCFENVLELNPTHPTARKQLNKLDQQMLEEAMSPGSAQAAPRSRLRRRLVLLVLIVIGVLVALVAWGVV